MVVSNSLVDTIKEINEKVDKCIYIVKINDIIIGSSWKNDLDKYLCSDECLIGPHDDISTVILIYGWVLDPLALPVKIPASSLQDNRLWLLMNDVGNSIIMEPCNDIQEVTDSIEKALDSDEGISIDDFAVIMGEEMDLALVVEKTGETIVQKDVYED
ncbi:hypothetical protein LCGC14_0682470 [marine sediment metagenome]|uniref:Uncharacterized protein n=1 Tax=marine sediment metagenome TaxID=412755 RepID=A0A0F9TVW0_9ZZZZ